MTNSLYIHILPSPAIRGHGGYLGHNPAIRLLSRLVMQRYSEYLLISSSSTQNIPISFIPPKGSYLLLPKFHVFKIIYSYMYFQVLSWSIRHSHKSIINQDWDVNYKTFSLFSHKRIIKIRALMTTFSYMRK